MKKGKISIIAAGIIFNESRDKILLIKRTDSMWGDVWSIPGGHIEYGETAEEALIRELKEELALAVIDLKFLDYEEFTVAAKQFISLNFIVRAKEKISLNNEIKEAKWFDFSELKKINHKIPSEALKLII